ncbi:hypothetical protein HDK77DRAFT_446288 [Phyllosticta capitalensis]
MSHIRHPTPTPTPAPTTPTSTPAPRPPAQSLPRHVVPPRLPRRRRRHLPDPFLVAHGRSLQARRAVSWSGGYRGRKYVRRSWTLVSVDCGQGERKRWRWGVVSPAVSMASAMTGAIKHLGTRCVFISSTMMVTRRRWPGWRWRALASLARWMPRRRGCGVVDDAIAAPAPASLPPSVLSSTRAGIARSRHIYIHRLGRGMSLTPRLAMVMPPLQIQGSTLVLIPRLLAPRRQPHLAVSRRQRGGCGRRVVAVVIGAA